MAEALLAGISIELGLAAIPCAAGLWFLLRAMGLEIASRTGFIALFLALAVFVTLVPRIEPTAGTETSIAEGVVVALVFREAYSHDSAEGRSQEGLGWYLKFAKEAPQDLAKGTVSTTIEPFATLGENPELVAHPDTPGATLRQAIAGYGATPLQICTGLCEGIAGLTDSEIRNEEGMVAASWQRVMQSVPGVSKGFYPIHRKIAPPAPATPGEAILTALVTLGVAAAATLIGAGALLTVRARRAPPVMRA